MLNLYQKFINGLIAINNLSVLLNHIINDGGFDLVSVIYDNNSIAVDFVPQLMSKQNNISWYITKLNKSDCKVMWTGEAHKPIEILVWNMESYESNKILVVNDLGFNVILIVLKSENKDSISAYSIYQNISRFSAPKGNFVIVFLNPDKKSEWYFNYELRREDKIPSLTIKNEISNDDLNEIGKDLYRFMMTEYNRNIKLLVSVGVTPLAEQTTTLNLNNDFHLYNRLMGKELYMMNLIRNKLKYKCVCFVESSLFGQLYLLQQNGTREIYDELNNFYLKPLDANEVFQMFSTINHTIFRLFCANARSVVKTRKRMLELSFKQIRSSAHEAGERISALFPYDSVDRVFLIIRSKKPISTDGESNTFQLHSIMLWLTIVFISTLILSIIRFFFDEQRRRTLLQSMEDSFRTTFGGSVQTTSIMHTSEKVFIIALAFLALFFNIYFTDKLFDEYSNSINQIQRMSLDEFSNTKMTIYMHRFYMLKQDRLQIQ